MSSALERGLSVILCVSAVTLAGSVAWREFGTPPLSDATMRSAPPVYTPGWEDALLVGVRVGEQTAKIAVVEFSDMECAACARFQRTIEEVLDEYPLDVAFIFVHLPLEGHRFARQAARVAECAETRGLFFPMISVLFGKQDSLGLKSWGSFALEAGISDSASISACAWDSSPVARIDAGLALAKKLDVTATPTVLVNGWKYVGPSKEQLNRAIEAALKGESPGDAGMN
ncbi:MAG: thioredoxin domain-containing protein [Gemmatimonadota bacterium]|nr:thioredoxin domain-containing protein [Gemmatimonadota bacterium]